MDIIIKYITIYLNYNIHKYIKLTSLENNIKMKMRDEVVQGNWVSPYLKLISASWDVSSPFYNFFNI